MVIEETVYIDIEISHTNNSYILHVEGTDFGSVFNVGVSYLIKFSDHFLCSTEIKQDEGQLVNLIPSTLADGAAMERVKGIEPSFSAWEADVLPLNYTRKKVNYT